jgi:hypothetical protein
MEVAQLIRYARRVIFLIVLALAVYGFFINFTAPALLAFLLVYRVQPLLIWFLLLAGAALLGSITTYPPWERRGMPILFVTTITTITITTTGGLLLHGQLFPTQPTCPFHGAVERVEDVVRTSEAFCQFPVSMPPLNSGPLRLDSFPFINPDNYLQQLAGYACMLPFRYTLMVHGPKLNGKSAGLQVMANLWRSQGRVVININHKGLVGDYTDFLYYFQAEVKRSLCGLELTSSELQTCYICSEHRTKTPVHLKTQEPNFLSQWLHDYTLSTGRFLSQWLHDHYLEESANVFSQRLLHYELATAIGQWLRNGGVDSYLQYVFATTDMALGMNFRGLMEFLELVAIQRPQAAPVLILHDIQLLQDIGGGALLSNILHTLEARKRDSLVGVIIESSEHPWELFQVVRSSYAFWPHLVSYMDHETMRKELVDMLKVFSPTDFEAVWAAVKGHGGSLRRIVEDVVSGTPLDQAIAAARHDTFQMLLAALRNAPHDRVEELERLRKADWLLKELMPMWNPHLHFLIKENVLFIASTSFVPQHEMMRWAIDKYLTTLPVPLAKQ